MRAAPASANGAPVSEPCIFIGFGDHTWKVVVGIGLGGFLAFVLLLIFI